MQKECKQTKQYRERREFRHSRELLRGATATLLKTHLVIKLHNF